MGGLTTQAANWTANLTTEIKVTRRRLSLEIHDKLQRGPGGSRGRKASPEGPEQDGGGPLSLPPPPPPAEQEDEEDSRPFDLLGEELAFIDAEDSDRRSGRPSPLPALRRAKHRGRRKQPRRANGYPGRQEHSSPTTDKGEDV
ncbi:potassium channel subfamily K member 4-like [Chiloscyllium plagiosum]|uniref:potassium channel subfamily K member 4-like n=1 Tax=Chiloscyllium plagiosum TaxID=36176 RepID=UPI001CB80CE8|nr:potassium channel subfamily K member 4-like [Chiloscyllium plagiosum]